MNKLSVVRVGTLMFVPGGCRPPSRSRPASPRTWPFPPGANTTDKAAPFFIDTTGLDFKTAPPTRDPTQPELSARHRAGRRHAAAGRRRGQLHHRPDPCARARDRRQGRRAEGHDHLVHDVVEGQHDLQPRPDPRRSAGLRQRLDHDRDDRAGRQVEHDRHHQPSRHLDAHDRRLRAGEATCAAPRRRSSSIGDGGSTAWKDLATILDNLIQQRRVPPMIAIQIGNGGQDAQGAQRGARIRHGVGHLRAVRRARGAAAGRAARRREAHEEPRGPRDHGPELERHRGLHHGAGSIPSSIAGCWPIRRPW